MGVAMLGVLRGGRVNVFLKFCQFLVLCFRWSPSISSATGAPPSHNCYIFDLFCIAYLFLFFVRDGSPFLGLCLFVNVTKFYFDLQCTFLLWQINILID